MPRVRRQQHQRGKMKRVNNTVTKVVEEIPHCLLNHITTIIVDEILNFRDYFNWHRTCRTVWKPLSVHMYDAYMLSFIEKSMIRNDRLFYLTKDAKVMKDIMLLEGLKMLTKLSVAFIVMIDIATKKYEDAHTLVAYTAITIIDQDKFKKIGFIRDPKDKEIEKPLASKYIEVLNIFHVYIKHRYGWDMFLRSNGGTTIYPPFRYKQNIMISQYILACKIIDMVRKDDDGNDIIKSFFH